jgi:hypothetical protein
MEAGKSFFRTLFDDPVTKIRAWSIDVEQRMMRRVISQKYNGTLKPNVYWVTGSPEENDGMSADPVERLVQRLSLSQVGNFLAQRIWSRRRIVTLVAVVAGAVAAYLKFNIAPSMPTPMFGSLVSAVSVWVGVMVAFGSSISPTFIASHLLPRVPVRQDEIDAVRATMERCVVRPVDESTPADLRDRLRVAVTDAEGRAVAGQILATDLEYSAVRAEWVNSRKVLRALGFSLMAPAAIAFSPWAAVAVFVAAQWDKIKALFSDTPTGERNFVGVAAIVLFVAFLITPVAQSSVEAHAPVSVGWLYTVIMWFLAVHLALTTIAPLKFRALQLDQSVRETGTELLIDKAGREHFVQLENARTEQVENAAKDETPFLKFATSTGLLAQRRDPLAPSEKGLPVGLTVYDLSRHLMALGAPGTGKTRGVLRPMVSQWIRENMGGALVLDGKGALPLEFETIPGFTLISPKRDKLNPIDGMGPDAVADVLADVFSADDKGEAIWRDAARLMLRMASISLHASPDFAFTIPQILRFCVDVNLQKQVLIPHEDSPDSRVQAAFHYWAVEVPEMPEKTLGSIVNMVRTWLGNIVMHEKLGPWCDTTETGWQVENVLRGEKAGLLLPESEYGIGGVAISALTMRRVYDAVKLRGDRWQEQEGQQAVLMCADEVQNLLTKADLETVPVARSLGLYLLSATQNVDGLYKRLEKDGALQLLGSYSSLIVLPPKTKDSNEYVEERVGRIWKATSEGYQGLPDAQADIGLYTNSGVDIQVRQSALLRQGYVSTPRLAYSIGLWHREYAVKSAVLGDKLHELMTPDDNYTPISKPTLSMTPTSLVQAQEIDTLLARPGTAIAILNRGQAVRRDVVRLSAFDAA